MTPAERLLAQMRTQRLRWVELEPAADGRAAKRVQILRPPENDVADFVTSTPDGRFTLQADLAHVHRYTVGWDGFTEADLVGPAGSGDAVAFAPELWRAVAEDRLAWLRLVAQALLDAMVEHRAARAADAKN